MSKYLHKASSIGVGLSMPAVLVADVARSQAKPAKTEANPPRTVGGVVLPDPNAINKKIQQNYPPELLEDGNPNNVPTRLAESESTSDRPNEISGATPVDGRIGKGDNSANGTKTVGNVMKSNGDNTTTLGNANYTFVISTPVVIALAVIVGGLALFPVVTLLLNSKKVAKLRKSSPIKKFLDRFRKPQVLESDKFLHQRTYEKLLQIADRAEDMNADKFGNTEFMVFFKIKSFIARSLDEYANLDEVIELLGVAIDAQSSFSKIDSTESRFCSGGQQKLYKFVNSLLTQEIEPSEFRQQIAQKLEEILPLLQTEEGKVALQAYVSEINKISQHALGLKLMLLFKKYQLEDYSTLRGVSNTINQLDSEDLLNLDALLLLVMVKYDVFEKLGPIVGIAEQYNRPETYSKMLQYIGLKARHEVSYQKFQDFLLLLKQWEIHYKTLVNVRDKYSAKDYQIPKEFNSEAPGFALYKKYKDSFHLIAAPAAPPTASAKVEKNESESPSLTGVG